MGLSKNRLVFDATNMPDSDSVGAYVRASDGTLITHTTNGAIEALDVSISNASIVVTATDLDIRNLVFATDKVDVSGSVIALDAPTLAALENITVSATDLDIRDLSHTQDSIKIGDGTDFALVSAAGELSVLDSQSLAVLSTIDTSLNNIEADIDSLAKLEDSAHVSGDAGIMPLAVRKDAAGTMVSADGDYSPLQVDQFGNLRTTLANVDFSYDYAEDSAHVSGDIGVFNLSVREDTLASSTSASGDYQAFKTDALGRLWMNETSQSMAHSAVSVAAIATDLVPTDLVNRKRILIQNTSSKKVFIGGASVTTANGIELSPGANAELLAGPGIDLYGITASGSADVRIMELA